MLEKASFFGGLEKACWSYVMLLRAGEVPPLGKQKPSPRMQHHAPPGDVRRPGQPNGVQGIFFCFTPLGGCTCFTPSLQRVLFVFLSAQGVFVCFTLFAKCFCLVVSITDGSTGCQQGALNAASMEPSNNVMWSKKLTRGCPLNVAKAAF